MSTEQDDLETIKRRIQKLLAMGQDGRGNENEAEAAMRMAEKLIRKHNIELADLQKNTGQKPKFYWSYVCCPAAATGAKPVVWKPMWIGYLGVAVANFTDCRVTWAGSKELGYGVIFQGDAFDLEYAKWLFEQLRDFGYASSLAARGEDRENFRKAYAIRLQERVHEMKRERDEALRTSSCTALAVISTKLVERDKVFGKQTFAHKQVNFRTGGYSAGRAAADRANFSRPVGTTRRTEISA
jgi:hypothetical protein